MASGHQQRLRARQRPSILLPLLGRCQVPAALLRSFRVDWGDSSSPSSCTGNPRVPARSQGSDLASSPPCAPAPRHAPLVSRLTALQPLFLAVPYAPGDSSKLPYPTLSPGTLFPNIHFPNPTAAKPGHPVPQSSSRFRLPFFPATPETPHTLLLAPPVCWHACSTTVDSLLSTGASQTQGHTSLSFHRRVLNDSGRQELHKH